VTPEELQRALRDSMSRQSATPPPVVDRAGAAIQRGRRVQRWRTVTGVAMAAVATALVSTVVAQLGGPVPGGPGIAVIGDPFVAPPSSAETATTTPHGGSPDPVRSTPPDGPPAIDVVVGSDLRTAAGARIDLSAVGPVTAARRAPDGWLVITRPATGKAGLWFVTATDRPRAVLPAVDVVALAPDGQRVSWRADGRLWAGTLSDGVFSTSTEISAPPGVEPAGFIGVAVLLRRAAHSGGGYGLWWPGERFPNWSWSSTTVGVYGQLPDGHGVLGLVSVNRSARPCLALLDNSRALAPVKTACDAPLSVDGRGAVSPDGRWLVANGDPTRSAGAGQRLSVVVDLAAAFERPSGAKPAGPALTGDPVWTDAGSLTHLTEQGELIRVAADQIVAGGEGIERFPVPDAKRGDHLVLVASVS
jgi:hypothetical protein